MKKLIAFIIKYVRYLFGNIKTFDQFLEAIQKEEIENVTITVRNTYFFPEYSPIISFPGTVTYDLHLTASTAKGRTIDFIDTNFSSWDYINSSEEKINKAKIISLARDYASKIEKCKKAIVVDIFHEEKPIRVSAVNYAT
jgi:hypothetical protein